MQAPCSPSKYSYGYATQFYKALKNPKISTSKPQKKSPKYAFTKVKKIPKGANGILPQIPTFT